MSIANLTSPDVVNLSSSFVVVSISINDYSSYSFHPILTKLDIYDHWANALHFGKEIAPWAPAEAIKKYKNDDFKTFLVLQIFYKAKIKIIEKQHSSYISLKLDIYNQWSNVLWKYWDKTPEIPGRNTQWILCVSQLH